MEAVRQAAGITRKTGANVACAPFYHPTLRGTVVFARQPRVHCLTKRPAKTSGPWRMLRRPLLFAGAAAVGFGACSARALSLSGQTDLSFKAPRGVLGPPRPTAAALAAGATDTGPLSVEDGVVYQGGAFSSLWIRVGCEPDLVSASALDVLVGAALAKQCTLPKPGAVCHGGLEPRISRPQAEHQTSRPHPSLLLTRLRLALDRCTSP